MDLLCKAIQENDVETQSKHFSEQLLNLTLSFLNKQLREIFTHREGRVGIMYLFDLNWYSLYQQQNFYFCNGFIYNFCAS